ncbi:MAG: nuclear transport factor 2 family protein [Chitinophagaceae bacterium]|nr:MAG: nuclear transport factor 2 family protein [Chitinophagaceae bacterium]
MSQHHKDILLKGNAAIAAENYEGFLDLCTDDTEWNFISDTVLRGKDAVRKWMEKNYVEPPVVVVDQLVSEGDFLVAIGTVTMKDENGEPIDYSYSDVWEFRGDKLARLKAFVIPKTS